MTERARRVVLLAEPQRHMMPALAGEMARRDRKWFCTAAVEGRDG